MTFIPKFINKRVSSSKCDYSIHIMTQYKTQRKKKTECKQNLSIGKLNICKSSSYFSRFFFVSLHIVNNILCPMTRISTNRIFIMNVSVKLGQERIWIRIDFVFKCNFSHHKNTKLSKCSCVRILHWKALWWRFSIGSKWYLRGSIFYCRSSLLSCFLCSLSQLNFTFLDFLLFLANV